MRRWLFIAAVVVLSGCLSVTCDGMSAGRAIRLHASDHESGLLAEHTWLRKNLPGFRLAEGGTNSAGEEVIYFPHRTEASGKTILSVYTVELPDGRVRDVFFDQSAYFAKGKKSPSQRPERKAGAASFSTSAPPAGEAHP